ncbi:N-acetylglucosamine-6-phosphate deacetylase [Photobacterium sp.]|uniref:N-acetylglucosamine-6-phosphate deacetylase n=1 Tax=Photobacterium sp. TaxID=660 RepID=UPI00299D4287|nr:N-acetylglucosamine-6-phosphate deacetylase [Photobacterium sp.]MDX1301033.1 N-acetylglucosamine-6-phosphate deacetylase [Photobacterium sp.]
MTLRALSAKRIFDGESFHSDASLLWRDNKIISIIPTASLPIEAEVTDYPDGTVVPGFIDIQVNGGGGVMFNQITTADGIDTICRAHRKHGTAYLLPTLISDTAEKISQALKAAQTALTNDVPGVLGVHLEGPWLSIAKKGAHDSKHFYTPSEQALEQLPWLKTGTTLITLAPEEVSSQAISWLKERGILLSCGHSNATSADFTSDITANIDGFTHLFNAMSPLEGREPGVVGTALRLDKAWCSIITDGIHVSKQNVLLSQRIKPAGKLLVITDAMASVGSENSSFMLNDETISVQNGKLVNAQGNLAGAHIGMDESVANLIQWGVKESEAFRMASTYPAQALNLDSQLGSLKPGYRASVTIVNDQYLAEEVLVDGQFTH